jgi:hypothetical protein
VTKEASHRIVDSSDRVSGVVAAVEAGIAVGLLRRSSLHSDMSVMSKNLGIGITPASKVLMAANGSQKAGPQDVMIAAIRSAYLAKIQNIDHLCNLQQTSERAGRDRPPEKSEPPLSEVGTTHDARVIAKVTQFCELGTGCKY